MGKIIKILSAVFIIVCNFGIPQSVHGQTNAEQVLTIGRNIMSMEDYLLAIQYFNRAIKAKPYLSDPYFYRAIAKLNLDDLQGALEDCDLAIERNGFKPEQFKLRGYLRQVHGMDSLAIEDYNTAISLNPTDKYLFFYKGLALTELKQFQEADSILTQLVRENPKFDDGFTALGRLKLEEGDTISAIGNLKIATEISKTQINPYLMIAEIEWSRQNWEEAGEALDNAIRLKPEASDLYINRAYVRYNNDDFKGAMDDYSYCIELDPNNVSALFNRGLLRYEVKDLSKSIEDFSKVLRLDPDNFHAIYNRGLIYLELGRPKEALKDFTVISQRYPRFYPAYYAMAQAWRDMGNLQQTALNIRKGDALVAGYVHDPKRNRLDRPNAEPLRTEIQSEQEGEETEEQVMEKFDKLITVSKINDKELPYNEKIKGRVQDRDVNIAPEPLFAVSFVEGLSSLKQESNFFKEIEEINRSRLIEDPIYLSAGLQSEDFSDKLPALFDKTEKLAYKLEKEPGRPIDYLALGIDYTMIGNPQEAIKSLDKALSIDNRFITAYMARGFANYQLAQFEKSEKEDIMLYESMMRESVADFDRVLSLNPNLVYALYNKAVLLYLLNDFTDAEANLKKATEIDPSLGEAWFNLGLTKLKQGNKSEAFNYLSKAGELGIISSYNVIKRMQ